VDEVVSDKPFAYNKLYPGQTGRLRLEVDSMERVEGIVTYTCLDQTPAEMVDVL